MLPKDNRKRLELCHFDLPVHEIRRGYRSDVYFWRSKVVLERSGNRNRGLIQVFQKKDALLCGVDEALGILRMGIGHYTNLDRAYEVFDQYIDLKHEMRRLYLRERALHDDLVRHRRAVEEELESLWISTHADCQVRALFDSDAVAPWETALTLEGRISDFIHLETLFLGVLARRTRVATNVARIVEAAGSKPILYFPARFDHWAVQGGDGYAARVGGAAGVSTDAQASWWGHRGMGTVPHALIAAFEGDTAAAGRAYRRSLPQFKLTVLADFHNDCVAASLEAARTLGDELWGVRLDTAADMVDRSLAAESAAAGGEDDLCGVNEALVFKVREALDGAGFSRVKIVVSGGFDVDKVRRFEARGVPVDAYGVGSSLLRGQYDFTADIVQVEGRACAKEGRRFNPNDRLVPVDLDRLV